MTINYFWRRPAVIGLYWGILGGIVLILSFYLTYNLLFQILPYPLILIGALITVKYTCTSPKIFRALFIAGLIAFLVMSFILYIYIAFYENPHSGISFIGHLWRFGLLLGMGSASSFLLSLLARPVKSVHG